MRYLLITIVTLLVSTPSYAVINANVGVNASNQLYTMSPYGIGLHTSPYYNSLGDPSIDDRLEEAGVTALRFGGGGYADVYHWSIARPQWESGITGGGLSPWWGQSGNFGYVGPDNDFGSFAGLLDQIDNGKGIVTVNYGSALKLVGGQSQVPDYGGQPKEAAAWVAYANADPNIYGTVNDITIGVDQQGNDWKTAGYWARLRASTQSEYQSWATSDGVYDQYNQFLAVNHDAPVGIEYWEIGNETFGTGYYGGGDGYSVDYDVPYNGTNRDDHPDLSPAQYGQEVVEYAQLMKSIDPTIKIGAVLATPPDDYSWSYADLNDNGSKQGNEPYWNDEVLSQSGISSNVDFVMVHWYPWAGDNANADSLLSQVGSKIPHMIDGVTSGQDFGTSAGIRDSLALHGLPNAEIMVTEFNYFGSLQSGLEDAAESIFVADAYASWLERGVTSVQYLELLTKDFLSDATNPLVPGSAFYGVSMVDKLAEPGETFVGTSSNHSDVKIHAALQDDGSIALMLLNLDRNESANVDVDISGIALESTGTLYQLTGGMNLTETSVTNLGDSFTANIPARSIAVYVVDPVQNFAAEDLNQDGFVDGLDLGILLGNWSTSTTPDMGELNGIPPVDGLDLGLLLGAWSPPPVAATSVPEPGLVSMAFSLLLLNLAKSPLRRN